MGVLGALEGRMKSPAFSDQNKTPGDQIQAGLKEVQKSLALPGLAEKALDHFARAL
jgi:hypothetical protein